MRASGKGITIHDVASRAGVSITTVSRYMNGFYENMSESTRQRLEQVIRELDYRPNALARGLKSQNSMTIGCVMADMASPFSALLVKGINAVCREQGYKVLILDADNDPRLEAEAYKSLLNNPVEGIISNTTGRVDGELLAVAGAIPVVLADRVIETPGRIDSVVSDNAEASFAALRYLKEQGYRRVGFFSPPVEKISTRTARLAAFRRAAEELFGRNAEEDTFLYDPADPASLPEALRRFLGAGAKPCAIFSVNGAVTLELLRTMRRQGIELSGELGLCGFDDWAWSELLGPGITTLVADTYEMGVRSAELLLERIRGKEPGPARCIELKNVLTERGSTQIR